jgi:NADH-quinone oxidoreductase subunit C
MTKQDVLVRALQTVWSDATISITEAHHEVLLTCNVEQILPVLSLLRDDIAFLFDQLIDVCVVDYLTYGHSEWETDPATDHGFSRAVDRTQITLPEDGKPRFAVVYHLLSTVKNHRVRVKAWIDNATLVVPSVHTVWKSANWFEREAYDLYGILFDGHPDLRRILTDYGFIGHPFRKDFPVSGHVEMRYDASLQKVIYEPVDIEPRVSVPKVIRHDNRYLGKKEVSGD